MNRCDLNYYIFWVFYDYFEHIEDTIQIYNSVEGSPGDVIFFTCGLRTILLYDTLI